MRIIAHLDMDAFFANLEEADSPIFAGKPIVVGSDPHSPDGKGTGRGVVSTANYKAREYGIHSALPISKAWQLSQKAVVEGKPEVIFVQPNFERYTEVSQGILEIIRNNLDSRFSPRFAVEVGRGNDAKECGNEGVVVEQASIDEFYFDLSPENTIVESGDAFVGAEKICQQIKNEIKKKYKITCSVGLAPNKLIAKIAAGQKKPDGFVVVRHEEAEKFLEPLSVRELPGVGPKTQEKLNKENIFLVKDVKSFSQEYLHNMLGKFGQDLYNKVRGIDNEPLQEIKEAKSIGEQITFVKDTLDAVYIGDMFDKLCSDVFLRFKNSGFKNFKTIGITVRFKGFESHTTAKTLKENINTEKVFKLEALKILLPYLDKRKNPNKKLIRLIGISIKNFNN